MATDRKRGNGVESEIITMINIIFDDSLISLRDVLTTDLNKLG